MGERKLHLSVDNSNSRPIQAQRFSQTANSWQCSWGRNIQSAKGKDPWDNSEGPQEKTPKSYSLVSHRTQFILIAWGSMSVVLYQILSPLSVLENEHGINPPHLPVSDSLLAGKLLSHCGNSLCVKPRAASQGPSLPTSETESANPKSNAHPHSCPDAIGREQSLTQKQSQWGYKKGA